jgi:5'-deoxynucleotidase YfbR-like HD superfamily hydrolase
MYANTSPEGLHLIQRSARVLRYHTEDTLQKQTVGEHTYLVMWWVWVLSGGAPSAALLMAALAHDTPEVVTGDVPAPTKRRVGLRQAYEAMEDDVYEAIGYAAPALSTQERKLLKLADLLEGLMFCVSEIERGNRMILSVLRNYHNYIVEHTTLEDRTGPVAEALALADRCEAGAL